MSQLSPTAKPNWLIPAWLLLVSVIGAVVLNFVLTVNHKPGRYTGF